MFKKIKNVIFFTLRSPEKSYTIDEKIVVQFTMKFISRIWFNLSLCNSLCFRGEYVIFFIQIKVPIFKFKVKGVKQIIQKKCSYIFVKDEILSSCYKQKECTLLQKLYHTNTNIKEQGRVLSQIASKFIFFKQIFIRKLNRYV